MFIRVDPRLKPLRLFVETIYVKPGQRISAFPLSAFGVSFEIMIIARSPLRVTLGGGGTDLPSYYEKFGGFLIAAAIDKYVYITRARDVRVRT